MEHKQQFNEQYFLNHVDGFKNIKNIDDSLNDLNKLFIPIQNPKDRNIIKSRLTKYAILSYYKNNKVKDLVNEFNNKKNKSLFLPEYIEEIKKIDNEKLSILDYYKKTDQNNVLIIEDNCFFSTCPTDIIEVIEDNKNIYTTNDLIDLFEDNTNKRQNMDIVDNLVKMLNNKFENVDVFDEDLNLLINEKHLIPLTDEFKIINDMNNINIPNTDNKQQLTKIDYFTNLFNKQMNNTEHTKDLIVNQTELLNTINKYENNKNEDNIKNLEFLKYFFDNEYLNYSVNDKFVNCKNNKQFLSIRKSKLNDIKNIIRICPKDTNVIISGFCLLTDKEKNNKVLDNLEEFKNLINHYFSHNKFLSYTNIDDLKNDLKSHKVFLSTFVFKHDPQKETAEIIELIKHLKKNKNDEKSKEDKKIKIPKTDNNELMMFGYNENIEKLPEYKIKEKYKNNLIILQKNNNLVCQHIIDKRELEDLKRRKNFVKYEFLSYQFLKKYITIDFNGNKICRSCSEKINIKGLSDNAVDSVNNVELVNYNNLEYMTEYSQFGKTKTSDGLINNIDTTILDFGNLLNNASYSGFTFQQINVRKKLVKDTIDIIQNIRKILIIQYKEIKEFIPTIVKKYNINTQNNDYYIFKLDNSIYETSKQDQYQIKKRNNIIYYILFNFILNLTDQNYLDTLSKKIPLTKNSKNIYEEYQNNRKIFNNVKILVNGEKTDILKLDNLCFYFYVISRIMSQEKYKNKIVLKTEYKTVSIQAQIIIINSLITLFDTVLDCINYVKQNKASLANNSQGLTNIDIQNIEIMETKLNHQINNIFVNTQIVKNFYNDLNNIAEAIDKKIIKFEKLKDIKDNKHIKGYKQDPQNKMDGRVSLAYNNIERDNQDIQDYGYIELNESKELFHDFVYDGSIKEMKCKICGLLFSDIKKTKQKNVKDLLLNEYLNNRFKTFCPNGSIHKFDNDVCKNCGYKKNSKTENKKSTDKLYNSLKNGIVQNVKKTQIFNEIRNFDDIEILNRKKRKQEINKRLSLISDLIINMFGNTLNIDDKIIDLKNNKFFLNFDYKNNVLNPPKFYKAEKYKLNGKKVYKTQDDNTTVYYDYYLLNLLSYQVNKNITEIQEIKYQQNLNIEHSFINCIYNLFNTDRFVIFKNLKDVFVYIDKFNNSLNNFKHLLTVYIQRIKNKYKFIEPIDDKYKNDKNVILSINNLMFNIQEYYDKFDQHKNFNNLFSNNIILNDSKEKLNFISFNKIYETKKINRLINSLNIKFLIFCNDLEKMIKNNNRIFCDFLIKFIYYYFSTITNNKDLNNFLIFENAFKSENLTILDKTKINKVVGELSEEGIKEIEEKIKNVVNEDNEEDEKEETLDIDHDVENEDDIEDDDNDEF